MKKWTLYLSTFPNYELKNDVFKKLRKIGITSNLKRRKKDFPGVCIVDYISKPLTKNHARCIELSFVYEFRIMDDVVLLRGGVLGDRENEYMFCADDKFQEIIEMANEATNLTRRDHTKDIKNIMKEKLQYARRSRQLEKHMDLSLNNQQQK